MEALPIQQSDQDGTHVRRFLAHRGAIVVKEIRDLGRIKGNYGDSLSVATMIIAVVKGTTRQTSFGVKLERHEPNTQLGSSAFLDFDELAELLDSFDFISSFARDLRAQQRDYTEINYSTKDNARFGFYQNQDEQLAFVALNLTGDSLFFPVERLLELKGLLSDARNHLVSKGADDV